MAEKGFKLSSGSKIKIKPISPHMIARLTPTVYKEMGIEIPTYEVTTVGGGKQQFPHNETTLEVEGDSEQTEANIQLWDEYKQSLILAHLEINSRFTELLMRRGVDVEVPEDDSWLADHRELGIEIPEDPMQLKIMYIQDELIQTKSDWMRLIDAIMALSDISEEDVAAAAESFPDQMEGEGTG